PDENLPNETLVHIFSFLSLGDLTKVALASHRFNVIAERVLYLSINIAEELTEDSDVPKRTLGWCDGMKRNQLYDVPRKLSISWRIDVDIGESKTLPHSCSLLSDTICRLTLLDTLKLFMGPSRENTTPALELVIRDLRLLNIRHCSLNAGEPGWTRFSSYCTLKPSVMCAFIASHSGLRYLAVLEISESAMELVPHDALPELSIFYGTASGAAFILTGRPVHHLLLIGREGDLGNKNLSRMALTSVPLRILDLSAMYVSPSALRDIGTHLPTIEIFRVNLKLDRTRSIVSRPYSHSFCYFLGDLSCLVLFNKLHWFDLSPTLKDDLEMDDQRSLCYEWYSVCPSLRHIFFPFNEPVMWELNEDRCWFTCELPTRGSADGLYWYTTKYFISGDEWRLVISDH
ncbi:hypothetical protein F5887DRAFT_886747, partial [Amanita rubescens]